MPTPERVTKDTTLTAYFDYGVHIQSRKVFLTSDIDQDSVGYIIKGIYLMNDMSESEPIELYVNTDGGSLYDMFALHDVLRTVKCPVHTIGLGRVMSAGPLLVAAGTKGERWAGQHTQFMVHQSWWWMTGRTEEHESMVKHVKDMGDQWFELMAKYTKKDAKFWKRVSQAKTDTYFDAETAIEYGVIDSIWDDER